MEESIPFNPSPVEETTVPEQVVEQKIVKEKTEDTTEINTAHLADTLANINGALAPMLRMSKIKVRDGIYYVVAQDIFKITMSSNKEFTESLKGLLKCEHLKYVTDAEFNGTDNKDPLEDIIAMADDIDQISIF